MRGTLDRLTGRVTMYRLVTLTLAVLALAAIGFSLLGLLAYGPVELMANLATALAATLVSSRIFALAFRTRPHTESSIITALILFFLFWPTLEPVDLGTLALACLLATASKYLLVWRGRHIVNPAAAGATLVAVLQLNGSVWWVATGVLLPFALVGAFLILYRTARLPMGLVFIAVAASILVVRFATDGTGVADAVSTAFSSYPIIFFAGFMLTEPLTLPPRRWQQLVLAAVVGVLFTVPFTFGPIYLSFEFALILGNVLAFLVGQRRAIRLDFVGKRQLTPTSWEFQFEPHRPLSHRAGQWLEFTVPHGTQDARGARRIFSIASRPGAPVAIGLRMPERASSFKRALLELEPGALVRATSVGGDFLLPRDAREKVLLVAGGIGITPFLSQLAHDRETGIERDVVLVYSVSSLDELAFVDELRLERVLLVAPDAPHDLPGSWRWIGSGPIDADLLGHEVPGLSSRRAYVSGAPSTVNHVRRELRRAGLRRVETDYFSGY